MTDGCDISSEIALKLTSWDLSDDKSTLVQLMAWCHQATSHYLNQCWPKSLPPYGVTRPQWVNGIQIAPVFEIATPLTLKQGAAAAPHFQILDAALMGHLSTVLAFEKWYWQIDVLAQDCSSSSSLAMELMQSCAKASKLLSHWWCMKWYHGPWHV